MRNPTATLFALMSLLLAGACGGSSSQCEGCGPGSCASVEPLAIGSLFYDGPGSAEPAGSENDTKKVFSFEAPTTARYRVVVKSNRTASVEVRTECGRPDSQILYQRGGSRQWLVSTVGEFSVDEGQEVFITVRFDDFLPPFGIDILRQDGGCVGEGERVAGEGHGVKLVMVPCRFAEEDRDEFHAITENIRRAFLAVEPYRSNPDLFSLYRVADFSAANLPPDQDIACKDAPEIAAAASACPFDRIISLASGAQTALAGGVTALVAVSDLYPAEGAPGVALHESGHLLGLAEHPCMDGDEPTDFVPRELSNCASTQVRPNEPCPAWAGPEYLEWVLPGDPPFGCFQGCNNNLTLYRPWETDVPFQGSIMCHTRDLNPGFTPVDRKILFDRLRYGADY